MPHLTLGYTQNIFEKRGLSKVDPAPVSAFVAGQPFPVPVAGGVDPPHAEIRMLTAIATANTSAMRDRFTIRPPTRVLARLKKLYLYHTIGIYPHPLSSHLYRSTHALTMLYGYVKGR